MEHFRWFAGEKNDRLSINNTAEPNCNAFITYFVGQTCTRNTMRNGNTYINIRTDFFSRQHNSMGESFGRLEIKYSP